MGKFKLVFPFPNILERNIQGRGKAGRESLEGSRRKWGIKSVRLKQHGNKVEIKEKMEQKVCTENKSVF